MLRSVCFCITAVIASHASAFEIDGLKSGQSRAESVAQLQRLDLEIEKGESGQLHGTAPDGRLYSLSFCGDALVQVQKCLAPSFKDFVELLYRMRELYGSPIVVLPELPDPTSHAKSHKLAIAWRHRQELVTAEFIRFDSNDQLDVTYEVRNSCFANPHLAR